MNLLSLDDDAALALMRSARGDVSRHGVSKRRHGLTAGTWLAGAKASPRQIVAAATLFCMARKGISSLQLARTIGVQPVTAYKLMMRFRNALLADSDGITLSGTVEIDGAFFGGHVEHENSVRAGRSYRYSRRNRTNRRVVVVARQRGGRTLTFVGAKESDALAFIHARVDPKATIISDQSHAWDGLAALYSSLRISHKFAFAIGTTSTNHAESFFASLRRMQMGTHHKISGPYLHLYANEMAWRTDHKHWTEKAKVNALLAATLSPAPMQGDPMYWQPRRAPPTLGLAAQSR